MQVILGIVAGAIITIAVSRYFFRESLKVNIEVFAHQSSTIFEGVDDDVRHQLSLQFADREIADLSHVEYLIANNGRHPIANYKQPLTLHAPTGTRILDAALLFVSPEGRSIRVSADERTATLHFDVLNPGEYFLVKVLLEGLAHAHEMDFSIAAENLPPRIVPKLTGYDVAEANESFEWGLLLASIVVLALPLSMFGFVALYATEQQRVIPWGGDFSPRILELVAIIPTIALALLLLLFGVMMMLAAAFGGSFPPRDSFRLPEHLRRSSYYARHGVVLGTPGARPSRTDKS